MTEIYAGLELLIPQSWFPQYFTCFSQYFLDDILKLHLLVSPTAYQRDFHKLRKPHLSQS